MKNSVLQNLFGYLSSDEEENSEGDDEGSNYEDKGNAEVEEIRSARKVTHHCNLRISESSAVTHHYHLRSSRSHDNDKGKGVAVSSTDGVEDLHGEKQKEVAVWNKTSEKNVSHKRDPAQEPNAEDILCCENATHKGEESTDTELKENSDVCPTVYEIPFRRPLDQSDQIAIFKLPSVIAIDPRPFDPGTYVGEDIYVDHSLRCRRRVPPTNVIRWRKVKDPNGTTVIESNARFVWWSDGSIQLLIGMEAFNLSLHDAKDIHSYIFQQYGKEIFVCQGRVTQKMNLVPTSLSSASCDHGAPPWIRGQKISAKCANTFQIWITENALSKSPKICSICLDM